MAVVVLQSALGCATWDLPTTSGEFSLPIPKPDPTCVVYEMAFVRWPAESTEEANALWKAIDEQFLPPALRQELAANGLRIGVLSDPLPEVIRNLLDATSDPLAVITDQNAVPGTEVLTRRERRQCPSGSREEIEVLPQFDGQKVVLINELERIRAQTFDHPRGYFQFTVQTVSDGQVRFELLPVVDYGEQRKRIIGGRNAFRFDFRRDHEAFPNLAVASSLARAQTLVVTASPDKKGLGGLFFADRFEAEDDRLLLLLRVTESQRDELFAPRREIETLVTPLD